MLFKAVVSGFLLAGCVVTEAAQHGGHHYHARQYPASQGTNETEYEYVVVGSGPGGGPVAARLALAGFKVLLIEGEICPSGMNTFADSRQPAATTPTTSMCRSRHTISKPERIIR